MSETTTPPGYQRCPSCDTLNNSRRLQCVKCGAELPNLSPVGAPTGGPDTVETTVVAEADSEAAVDGSTPAKLVNPGAGERFGGCLFFVFAGLGFSIIPFVGLFAFPVLLILGLGALIQGRHHKGKCPYCGHENQVGEGRPGANCGACKRRFLVKDGRFWQAPA
jgi:hypothetical protein